MASQSRTDLLRELERGRNRHRDSDFLEVVQQCQDMIEPQFKDDFLRIVLEDHYAPRPEFIDHWTNDTNCRQAMKLVLGFKAERTRKMASTQLALAHL